MIKKQLFLLFLSLFLFSPDALYSNFNFKNLEVSIITSVYNGTHFMESFLKNITSQSIFNKCELILVIAKSSTQNYEEKVVKKYKSKYPNIIYKKLNYDPGVYGCWNIAINMASGKYITNANIDDSRSKDSCELQLNFLKNYPELDLVYSDFYITNIPNQTIEQLKLQDLSLVKKSEDIFNIRSCMFGPALMWTKRLHKKAGYFNESYKHCGDWEMWLRAISEGCKVKKMPGASALYYRNPAGLSTNNLFLDPRVFEFKKIETKYKDLNEKLLRHSKKI